MAQPVWVLSVDLQAKTATFQSGMAEAAKKARGAFTDIKEGASEAGSHVSTNMFASRHAVMAVSEAFGDTMPRAITALLVHIGPLGAALEAAFPFAAIALGAVLLIEHLQKMKEAGIKLTEDQVKFGTVVQNTFNALDSRLTQAQIRSDELRNDHLGALRLQLELINRQSMQELVHSFEEVAKSADVVFAELKSNWYQFGIGSAGAQHALEGFKTQYESLISKGKDAEASDLLKGTLASAQKVLELQNRAKSTSGAATESGDDSRAKLQEHEDALNALKAYGVGFTEKELKAQETLVGALNAQLTIEGKVAALKKLDSGNASATTGKEMASLRAESARAAAEHSQKMAEITLATEKEQAEGALAVRNAGIAEKLASDIHFENESYRIHSEGNDALIAALDKGGKDYNNQLKALQEKAEELTAQHTANLSKLGSKATEDGYKESLAHMELGERESIEATEQGSKARLAAIQAAMKAQEALGLQESAFYKDLDKQRIEAQRQSTEEAAKLAEEAGKEEAENTQKMGELMLAADHQKQALLDSSRRVSIQQRLNEETQAANAEYALKLQAMQREAAALDKGAKDYENKLKAIQNKEKQLTQQHENEITQIKDKAEIERNQRILSAETRFNDEIATGLTQVLMGHKSFASMMSSLGGQVVSGMLENSIRIAMMRNTDQLSAARAAASDAYAAGVKIGGPLAPVVGALYGAEAFASVMAFEGGGIVPGIGRGDTVPAMLTPGEGIVPGSVMDGLSKMARAGEMGGGGNHYHAPIHYAPVIQAVDGTGVERMLDKHGDKFQRHVESTLRKLNR